MWAAVLFDLDDTLIDRSAALSRFAGALVERYPRVVDRVPDLAERLRVLDGGAQTDRQVFAVAVVRELGLPIGPQAFLEEFVEGMAAFATPWPETRAVLAHVGARAKVAIVTNGASRTQRRKVENTALGGLVQEVFVSSELGIEKPAPGIFARALAWAGCAPAEALFVGDDPWRDVAGAAAAGMATAWLAHGRVFPPDVVPPSHVLPRLAALEALVP